MKYQAILFDLDGTLLPMDEPRFVRALVHGMVKCLDDDLSKFASIALGLQASLRHVIANDGGCTNKQAFVRYYDEHKDEIGVHVTLDITEQYYSTEFAQAVQDTCGCDPEAAELVAYLKQTGTPMVVATNPFFPRVATFTRIKRAGLDPSDFAEITTYEDYHYCKPNLQYYKELFARTGLNPAKCLMVGNNVDEDMIARHLGCEVFLVTRNLINAKNADISEFKHGSLRDLLHFLQNTH